MQIVKYINDAISTVLCWNLVSGINNSLQPLTTQKLGMSYASSWLDSIVVHLIGTSEFALTALTFKLKPILNLTRSLTFRPLKPSQRLFITPSTNMWLVSYSACSQCQACNFWFIIFLASPNTRSGDETNLKISSLSSQTLIC